MERECPYTLGESVEVRPESDLTPERRNHLPAWRSGRIVYRHPKGRYVLVLVQIGRADLRECFVPEDVRRGE